MILAFLLLFLGCMLLGGTWSFWRSKKPWWSVLALAVLGLACVGVALWRIQTG